MTSLPSASLMSLKISEDVDAFAHFPTQKQVRVGDRVRVRVRVRLGVGVS
jgi:hypothetical protein